MPKQRRPALTPEFVRSILDYDPLTGIFHWRYRHDMPKKWNTRYAGQPAGYLRKDGYIDIQITTADGREIYRAHQIAWVHYHGVWPEELMDHEKGARSDNRIVSIREADPSQNGCNKAMQRNNTSGFVGVSFDPQRKKWRARVNRAGKMHCLGFFDSAEEGAAMRSQYLRDIHGEFASLNPERAKYPHARDNQDHGRPAPLLDL